MKKTEKQKRDAVRKYQREYRKRRYHEDKEFREMLKSNSVKWQKENPEKYREITDRWQTENAEMLREYRKKWREDNAEAIKLYQQTRRKKENDKVDSTRKVHEV